MKTERRAMLRGLLFAPVIVAMAAMAATPLHAQQEYPNRPIRIVTGYAAGTGADALTRTVAEGIATLAGVPVLVENRVGQVTILAAEFVSKAKPDGHTLFLTGGNSTFSANAYLFKSLPFDPLKSFTPIAAFARVPFVVLVPQAQPIYTMADLTRVLKEKKEKGSYAATTPINTTMIEWYKSIAGLETVQIPYKGPDQVIPDLISGAIDFMIIDAGSALPHIRANRLRAIAITTSQRSSYMPELPTMIESGFADFDVSAWMALYAPAGTPQAIIDKLADWVPRAMATDRGKQLLTNLRYEPMSSTPESVAKYHAEDVARWARLMRAAKIPQQ